MAWQRPLSEIVQQPAYRAYLLRAWHESGCWRFSLEEVGGEKRHGFADVESLATFLACLVTPDAKGEPGEEDR